MSLLPTLALLVGCTAPADGDAAGGADPGDGGLHGSAGDSGAAGADGGADGGGPDDAAADVRINELAAANDSLCEDDAGDEDDWVELVNADSVDVDLGGWTLRDAPSDTAGDGDQGGVFAFPADTRLSPGEHVVVWLDRDPDQGPLHADFKLDADGDGLVLHAPDGAVVDEATWTNLDADVVLGRFPDATGALQPSITATPGAANPDDAGSSTDPSDALFPEDEILSLDLTIPAEGLAALAADPFTYVEGSIGFDGVQLDGVGIRLKGHASLRDLGGKAAFRVSMDAFGGDARLRGLSALTLNNMVQDPSLVHEHVAYKLFRSLDVPAPRTAYVLLTLNGEDRGLYLHVETPDEHFLARWYDNAEGNLYEGAGGQDLTLAEYESLEQDERGSDDPDDRSDLLALAELLDRTPDTALVDQLEALVDIDEVERMWAGEILIGHWDGYFYSANNYRVYHDPSTDLLSLLPWGPDLTFQETRSIFHGKAALAFWMLEIPALAGHHKDVLGDAARTLLSLDLPAEAQATHDRVIDAFAADPYAEHSAADSDAALVATLAYLESWPALVQWGVDNDVDVGLDR